MTTYTPLSDEQWVELKPLFPEPLKRGRGKPHTPWRHVVNSILLVLLSKVKWSSIPKRDEFATKSASHRWFVIWDKNGFLKELIEAYKMTIRRDAEMAAPPRRQRVSKSVYRQMILSISDDSEDSDSPYMEKMALAGAGAPKERGFNL